MSADEYLLRLLTITIVACLGIYSLPRRQRRPQRAMSERERSQERKAFLEAESRLKADIQHVAQGKQETEADDAT